MLIFATHSGRARYLTAAGVRHEYLVTGVTEDDGVDWTLTVIERDRRDRVDYPYQGDDWTAAVTRAAAYEALGDVTDRERRDVLSAHIAADPEVAAAVAAENHRFFDVAVAAARARLDRADNGPAEPDADDDALLAKLMADVYEAPEAPSIRVTTRVQVADGRDGSDTHVTAFSPTGTRLRARLHLVNARASSSHAAVDAWAANGWTPVTWHPVEDTEAWARRYDEQASCEAAAYADAVTLLRAATLVLDGLTGAEVDEALVR